MSQRYYVVGPCKVAGVAPGGTVTREEVESWAGPDSTINFDALLGVHLEPATSDKGDKELTAKGPSAKGGATS